MTRRTTLITLSVLAALAFTARAGLMVQMRAWEKPNAMEHRSIAAALAAGQGFTFADWRYYGPSSVQSPPMPFLLGGLFKAFGVVHVADDGALVLDPTGAARSYAVVMVLNAVCGAGLVFLTYAAGRAMGASGVAAVAGAGLVAVWPTQVYAAQSVQVISLVTCLLAAMVALYERAVRTGSAGAWTAYAGVGAVAALTEPVFLPALAASGVLVLLAGRLTWGRRVRNGAILAVVTGAVLGPWAARNYVVHGQLIPVKGSFWVNVWKGNNDFATGTDRLRKTAADDARLAKVIAHGGVGEDLETHHQYDMLDLSQKMALRYQPEPRREVLFREYATTWIKAHPWGYARLCGVRLVKTLTIDWDNPQSLYKTYLIARAAVMLMTLAGLVVAWRQRWAMLYPATVAGCALLTYTLTLTSARFAFPFEPLQLVMGSAAAVAVVQWAAGRRGRADPRRGYEPVAVEMAVAG